MSPRSTQLWTVLRSTFQMVATCEATKMGSFGAMGDAAAGAAFARGVVALVDALLELARLGVEDPHEVVELRARDDAGDVRDGDGLRGVGGDGQDAGGIFVGALTRRADPEVGVDVAEGEGEDGEVEGRARADALAEGDEGGAGVVDEVEVVVRGRPEAEGVGDVLRARRVAQRVVARSNEVEHRHDARARRGVGLDEEHVRSVLQELVGDGVAPAREEAEHRHVREAEVAARRALALEARRLVGVVVAVAPVVDRLEVDVADGCQLRREVERLLGLLLRTTRHFATGHRHRSTCRLASCMIVPSLTGRKLRKQATL
jgi:hypothetical protein